MTGPRELRGGSLRFRMPWSPPAISAAAMPIIAALGTWTNTRGWPADRTGARDRLEQAAPFR